MHNLEDKFVFFVSYSDPCSKAATAHEPVCPFYSQIRQSESGWIPLQLANNLPGPVYCEEGELTEKSRGNNAIIHPNPRRWVPFDELWMWNTEAAGAFNEQ